jgi:hypothetical protein
MEGYDQIDKPTESSFRMKQSTLLDKLCSFENLRSKNILVHRPFSRARCEYERAGSNRICCVWAAVGVLAHPAI